MHTILSSTARIQRYVVTTIVQQIAYLCKTNSINNDVALYAG